MQLDSISPKVAAILNFLFWGSGYIYNRRRVYMGAVLLLAHFVIVSLLVWQTLVVSFYAIQLYALLFTAFALVFSIFLAWDAHREAVFLRENSSA